MTFPEFAELLDFEPTNEAGFYRSRDGKYFMRWGDVLGTEVIVLTGGNQRNVLHNAWGNKKNPFEQIVNKLRQFDYNAAVAYHRQRMLKALLE